MPSSEGELWVQAARQDMAIRTSATAPPPPAVLGAEAAAEIPVPTAAANNVADQSPSRDTEPSDKTVSFAGAASETIAKSPNKLIRRQSSIDREALSKARQKLVLYTASMNAIVSTAANTVYLPGLAMVEEEFDTSTAMVALTVTFYTIGACVQPLIAGPVADAIGRRRPMLVAHGVFILASVGCAVALAGGETVIK